MGFSFWRIGGLPPTWGSMGGLSRCPLFLSKKIYDLVEIYDAMLHFGCKEWIKVFGHDEDPTA